MKLVAFELCDPKVSQSKAGAKKWGWPDNPVANSTHGLNKEKALSRKWAVTNSPEKFQNFRQMRLISVHL